ncbi:hypothetical protein E2320_005043, partial [Naja naja]
CVISGLEHFRETLSSQLVANPVPGKRSGKTDFAIPDIFAGKSISTFKGTVFAFMNDKKNMVISSVHTF